MIEVVLALVFLIPLLLALLLLARRVLIARHAGISVGAMFTEPHAQWKSGMLALSSRHMEWYPLVGLSLTPKRVWQRQSVEVMGAVAATQAPSWLASAQSNLHVVTCRAVREDQALEDVQMIIGGDSYMALRSWAESSPPVDTRYEL